MELSDLKTKLETHKKNKKCLFNIYILATVISIALTTIVSTLLPISSTTKPSNKTLFILNATGTLLISIVNILKLESRITNHKRTIQEIQELLIDIDDPQQDLFEVIIKERLKSIHKKAPDVCI